MLPSYYGKVFTLDRIFACHIWRYRLNIHKNRLHSRRFRREHKDRVNAGQLARYHIPLKTNCEECGSTENLERHHEDYSKPLEVETLCSKCHGKRNNYEF